ncbi:MAG: UDP-N-acetylglucosamine 2-epimerase [Elusimicrobia bacterium RIFCSPHIGHO2_02_FULL_57_9]|nr:MAG: UDP-N-acetylglucosamine 2-epimerase [Elusimicrobia bacterium RIFCSPHIGHO2_02_FULL_57_9]
MKIMVVMGTRPEAIKLAPVIFALRRQSGFRVSICATAQHRDMLDLMLRTFSLKPHIDLNLMRPGQTPNEVLQRVIQGMDKVLEKTQPDLVLVQGDTTTVLGAALAAYHRRIAIGHVEAGLRTFDKWNPFPEEQNRVAVDHLSDLLFAPTQTARRRLLQEHIPFKNIFVTGNTAVDALVWAAKRPHRFEAPALRRLAAHKRLAVLTLHRRESFGAPMKRIFETLRNAAQERPELQWVYPVHPNPHVRAMAHQLLRHPNFTLVPPLGYLDFVHLMKKCEFIVTDSGGIQEEAPSLGKPVIVVRKATERGESLGRWSQLAGLPNGLKKAVLALADGKWRRPSRSNPFGDGRAAQKIVRIIRQWGKNV